MIPKASAAVLGASPHSNSLLSLVSLVARPVLPASSSSCSSTVTPSLRRHASTTETPGSSTHQHQYHEWPKTKTPSPYDIFGQHQHAPYSKTKFYELVKIYHPDTHKQGTVSETVRLERYRLVVAANTILSDPEKRKRYDRYGLGWDGPSGFDPCSRPGTNRSWRNEPGNASMNATWEDWERWYAERDGRASGSKVYAKQEPVYMPNGMFVFILCLLVMIGSVGQAKRANQSTMDLVEMREQSHMAISDSMRKRNTEQAMLNRHERVEHFLRQREGWRLTEADHRAYHHVQAHSQANVQKPKG